MPFVFKVKSGGECCQVRELAYLVSDRAATEAVHGLDKMRKAKTIEKAHEIAEQYIQRINGALSVGQGLHKWEPDADQAGQ